MSVLLALALTCIGAMIFAFFFFNDTATTEIYTLSLHDALPTSTGRQAVLVFERAFHGRTLLTMTMTSKVAYKKGFGPFAPEVYRVPAPYPYRGVTTDDALAALATLFKSEVEPSTIACAILEPVQGEGGFVVMPEDYPR